MWIWNWEEERETGRDGARNYVWEISWGTIKNKNIKYSIGYYKFKKVY